MFKRSKKALVKQRRGQRGSAVVIAVLVMALLSVFVAATLSRITTEALSTGNDYGNTQTFYAALGSLELMSRNFDDIFITKLNPTSTDITYVQNTTPTNLTNPSGLTFTYVQTATQIAANQTTTVASGPYRNLQAGRDAWELTSTCTGPNRVQVQVSRSFYNYRVPIFQFGIFYDNDMEFHPGPVFNFGGRVHSNRDIYMMCGNTLDFTSPVTAVGHIVRTINRNGHPQSGSWDGTVRVTNGSALTALTQGSVTGGPDTTTPVPTTPTRPTGTVNTSWNSYVTAFNGNILSGQPPLQLPLQVGNANSPIEIIKRGVSTDDAILSQSRYTNKACIRISLDDSRERLPRTYWPGDASHNEFGGVRLDGESDGPATGAGSGWDDVDDSSHPAASPTPGDRGYLPQAMVGGNQATRVNGWRFYRGATYTDGGGRPTPTSRQTWIKVEFVYQNVDDVQNPYTRDVTRAFLSLGLTDENVPTAFLAAASHPTDRAIVKLQRWAIPGLQVENGTISTSTDAVSGLSKPNYSYNSTNSLNFVDARTTSPGTPPVLQANNALASSFEANASHYVIAVNNERLVPFPIEMFDTREGLFNEGLANADLQTMYGGTMPNTLNVPVNGVMSMIDVDVLNLRNLVSGTYNALLPTAGNGSIQGGAIANSYTLPNGRTTMTNGTIPNHNGTGTILYVSDRRGDADFDGEYDQENVFLSASNEGIVGVTPALQVGEDTNGNNVLDWDYQWESATFTNVEHNRTTNTDTTLSSTVTRSGYQAFRDHKYFRRGVRLIKGGSSATGTTNLPGIAYGDWLARSSTQAAAYPDQEGFTLCSENAAYILGQYNQPLNLHPAWTAGGNPSAPSAYDVNSEVPASVVADCVYILSDAWRDSESFRSPFLSTTDRGSSETTVRTALLVGRPMPSMRNSPNQQTTSSFGQESNLTGGVHNFPRFLEDWNSDLNYCGSLINLYWSRVNTGTYKNGSSRVYEPPGRNWVFDVAFQDLRRLPPGTPFFQFVQASGFRQTFRQT